VLPRALGRLWRSAHRQPGKVSEAFPPSPPCSRSETRVFAPLFVQGLLTKGVSDGEVAHNEGTSEEQGDRHDPSLRTRAGHRTVFILYASAVVVDPP